MNFIRNRNFRAGPQTSLEGFICPQNSDKLQKNKVFGRSGGAIIRRFALFPLMLLMLLFLPAGMVAQKAASSSKYIATYDSDTETLTFEKYEGESLPSESEWVEDGTSVFDMFKDDYQNIKHIVINVILGNQEQLCYVMVPLWFLVALFVMRIICSSPRIKMI